MKQTFLFCLFALLLAFALPLLLSSPAAAPRAVAAERETAAPVTEAQVTASGIAVPAETGDFSADAGTLLSVRTADGVTETTMAEYLPLALAGEMPASFSVEALKAQAVALRTYALYYRAQPKTVHPDAAVCTNAGCCCAAANPAALRDAWGARYDEDWQKLCAAVQATDGQYLRYDDAPALTVFHASSAVCTEDGSALGVGLRYLVSVATPETSDLVTGLTTTVEVSPEEFRTAIRSVAPDAALDGSPDTWLGRTNLSASGRVASMEIGGQTVTGLTLRQLFSLRSTDFTLTAEADGSLRFRVRGYGHGLGMSQYGADLLARDGADCAAILSHYYPGTVLARVTE